MTASDPRVGEIQARASEFRPCKTDCCGSTECQSERDVAYLLAELADRDEKLARVEALAEEFRAEATASVNVEREIRKGPPTPENMAESARHDQHATIAVNHAARIRAAVAAAKGGGQ